MSITAQKLINKIKTNAKSSKDFYWVECVKIYSQSDILEIIDALKTNIILATIADFPTDVIYIKALANMLAFNHHIKNVHVEIIHEGLLPYFLEKLQKNQTIKKLEISLKNITLDSKMMDMLGMCLENNLQLVHLTINYDGYIDNLMMQALLNKLRSSKLTTLFLNIKNLTSEAAYIITEYFTVSNRLDNLVLYNCNVQDQLLIDLKYEISKISRKKILVLIKNPLTDIGLQALADSVLISKKLFVHFVQKRKEGNLMRFETVYIEPYLKRDAKMELKSFYYII